jgi:16S rRNA processing protein RimM
VLRPQGRRGEVAAALHTDFPERFAERKQLALLYADGRRQAVELESHWMHKGGVVLKLRGVDSISQAEALKGCEVQIPAGELTALEAGAAYISDLIGCTLHDRRRRREIGVIEDVQAGSGAPLLVVKQGKQEFLVPFALAYEPTVDATAKRMEMTLPEGLLED